MNIRTRFAPSPTGFVHIGSIQKILYSYACAKQADGQYIIRIEDTDQKRSVPGAEEAIYDIHKRLGIVVSESPEIGGAFQPYRQSERLDIYKKYAQELIANGFAYYSFETSEELAQMRAEQIKNKQKVGYDGRYRDYPIAEAQERINRVEKYVIRIKLPVAEKITFTDLILGEIEFSTQDLVDYVLIKSDGYPTYHLAVVVDDHLMEITHVFRGVEWISTTPIHIQLYKYLGWNPPQIGHIPNILDPKGGKLSKRSGSVAAHDFIKKGYLPSAIINYLILLGWSPKTDQEVFSLEEFVTIFNLKNLNKSNPIYNVVKLNWFNQMHIRKLSLPELTTTFLTWVNEFHPNFDHSKLTDKQLTAILELERERISLLEDLLPILEVFNNLPTSYEFDHKQLKNISKEILIEILKMYYEFIELEFSVKNGELDHESWEMKVRQIAEDLNLKAGEVFMTIRIAITGKSATPPLFEFGQIIGVANQLLRLRNCIEILKLDVVN